jgi:16S rRNA processing protein RimM
LLKTIGRITRTFGKRGGVVLDRTVEVDPADLVGRQLFVAPPLINIATVEVEKALVKDRRLILFFREIDSLVKSRNLVSRVLQIDEVELKEITGKADENFVGFKACTDDGAEIGVITDDLDYPAHRVLQISLHNGKEILVPLVDRFVVKVDRKNKTIFLCRDEYRRNWED